VRTYSLGVASIAAATGATYFTLHTAAANGVYIREIGLFVNAATASSVGLIRPSNTPVATTSVLGLPQNPSDVASTVNLDTAWSTAPTIGTAYLRKMTIPATIGNGLIWQFPTDAPLVVAASSWLIFWNYGAGTGSVLNGYVVWDE
jgi:hypothetical protein